MGRTKIEWADKTWNPIVGCTKISSGCANCYAENQVKRFAKQWGLDEKDPFKITFRPNMLFAPYLWAKSRIFVCSMGDLFHENVNDAWIHTVILSIGGHFKIKTKEMRHTFMLLTKRPENMRRVLKDFSDQNWLRDIDQLNHTLQKMEEHDCFEQWMDVNFMRNVRITVDQWCKEGMPGLWLGVTAENQETANERIPILLDIPAEKHFVSVEPMLGSVDLSFTVQVDHPANEGYGIDAITALDWVICGGESGHSARPINPDWARNLRDQCSVNFVPFLFKQWGEWAPDPGDQPIAALMDKNRHGMWIEDDVWRIGEDPYSRYENLMGTAMYRVGKKKAGRRLDGEVWDLYPNGIKNHKTEVVPDEI